MPVEIDSILTSIKGKLGLAEDYTFFDNELIMDINTALGTLSQLGIGPPGGFEIADKSAVWDEVLGGNPNLNPAKTFVYWTVKMQFDYSTLPGPTIVAIQAQLAELTWRLMVEADPVLVTTLPDDDEDVVLDGGGA